MTSDIRRLFLSSTPVGGRAIVNSDVAERRVLLNSRALMQVVVGLLWISTFLVVSYVVWTSRLLRPIADDYWIAVSAQDGLLEGVITWWQEWSGAVSTMTSNVLFVGLPLLHLPWSLASAVPFLCAMFLAVFATTWIFVQAIPKHPERRGFVIASLLFPILAVVWWGYWWLPALQAGDSDDTYRLALGVTHWQSLNAGYVIPIVLLIWLWLVLETRHGVKFRRIWAIYLLLGILAGFNGPTFAGAAFLTIVVLAVASGLGSQKAVRARGWCWVMTLLGILFGALASYFSPGSQYRTTYLANPDLNAVLISQWLTQAVPGGVSDWIRAAINPGAIVLLVVIVGYTAILVHLGFRPNARLLLTVGFALLGFALIASLVNRFAQFFAYQAFWHLTGPQTIAWLGLTAIAMGIGAYVAINVQQAQTRPVAVLGCAIGLLLFVSSITLMTQTILTRSVQWESGPAPLSGIEDIENSSGWVMAEWIKLRSLRDAPLRGPGEPDSMPG